MKTINALIYVMGIYGLTLSVTLFVVAVIIVIRWASSDRIRIGALDS
jgi:hypothetical protein